MASPLLWPMRALALGSTVYVGLHLYPVMDTMPARHAVMLTRAKEGMLARTGWERVARHARKGGVSCTNLIEEGVWDAVREAEGRDDVREAVEEALKALAGCRVQGEEAQA